MYIKEGLNTVQIATKIGCSSSGVGRLLIRNGIKPFHTACECNLSDEEIDEICSQYIDGSTTIEIGKMLELSDNTVAKILRQNNIPLRKSVRRSIIKNHNYFDTIDSIDKAYFLGWMISDGAIIESKTRPNRSKIISLEIHSKDRKILEAFAECLGAKEGAVKDFTKRNHSHLRFASQHMANSLEKFGVVPRKSWITFLPQIREDLMPHLIRGYFDGNGTVTLCQRKKELRFAFYGSKDICTGVVDYLHDTIGLNKNKISKSTCYHVWWGSKSALQLFYEYIYKDCGKYFLPRKRNKFIEYFSYHENTEVTY